MNSLDIVFGKIKRIDQPSLKSLLVWPEPQPVIKPIRGNSQQFITEFQDSYKIIKDPGTITPKIEENNETKAEENQEIIQENNETLSKSPKTEQKPKIIKKNVARNLSTRLLPNSAYASKFNKPVFACFGQGNQNNKNHRLFSKKNMKTYNILPYSKEHKSSSVFETAKLKYHQKNILSSNKALIENPEKTENFEINPEKTEILEKNPEKTENLEKNPEKTENLEKNPENTENLEEKTVEKVNFSTQQNENSLKAPLCLKCSIPLTTSENQPYHFVSKNISLQDPKTYKNLPFAYTKSIPFAGKPQQKSLSAYKTIFGDS